MEGRVGRGEGGRWRRGEKDFHLVQGRIYAIEGGVWIKEHCIQGVCLAFIRG